jgi:hypothetical protein
MSDDLVGWAENVREEVYEFWKTNYRNWDPGFQVWYGPVDSQKNVLIIGMQPGGDEDSFENKRIRFEEGEFSLPEEHDYLTSDFDLARDTGKAVPKQLIEQSVKTNINFFRAPRDSDWEEGLDENSRKDIEAYSLKKVQELIQRLDPDLIITEGTGVYEELISDLEFSTDMEKKHQIGDKEETLVYVGNGDGFTVVGLKHPSAGWGLGTEQYQEMKETIKEVYP